MKSLDINNRLKSNKNTKCRQNQKMLQKRPKLLEKLDSRLKSNLDMQLTWQKQKVQIYYKQDWIF